MLRAWAGIGEDDTEAGAFTKLEAAIDSLPGADAVELLPFVARVAGIEPGGAAAERLRGIEGDALERLLFSRMRALAIALTRLSPALLEIEDIHWADATSLELLASLARLVELSGMLAYHFGKAELLDKTEEYMLRAGESASCVGLMLGRQFGKRLLDARELEGLSILCESMMPLSQVSPLRWSVRAIGLLPFFLDCDMTGNRHLLLLLSGLPMLFGWTGISPRLSGRILEIVSRHASRDDPVVYAGYRDNAALHALVTGAWSDYEFHDPRMIDAAVAEGEIMMTITNIWADDIMRVERGELAAAARLELGRTLVEAGILLGSSAPGAEWSARGGELLLGLGIQP